MDDPSEEDTLKQFKAVFKPDGIGSEMVMLRTPNKPLQKSNRIVLFYLLLFNITLLMNIVVGIDG